MPVGTAVWVAVGSLGAVAKGTDSLVAVDVAVRVGVAIGVDVAVWGVAVGVVAAFAGTVNEGVIEETAVQVAVAVGVAEGVSVGASGIKPAAIAISSSDNRAAPSTSANRLLNKIPLATVLGWPSATNKQVGRSQLLFFTRNPAIS